MGQVGDQTVVALKKPSESTRCSSRKSPAGVVAGESEISTVSVSSPGASVQRRTGWTGAAALRTGAVAVIAPAWAGRTRAPSAATAVSRLRRRRAWTVAVRSIGAFFVRGGGAVRVAGRRIPRYLDAIAAPRATPDTRGSTAAGWHDAVGSSLQERCRPAAPLSSRAPLDRGVRG